MVFIMFIHSDRSMSFRRKELRNNPTQQEIILWKHLRKSNLGFKFTRQHSIGPYIVDFYCPKKRMIIEVDGNQHHENKKYDDTRTEYFKHLNHEVIRFWNSDINNELEAVLDKIKEALNITPPAAPLLI